MGSPGAAQEGVEPRQLGCSPQGSRGAPLYQVAHELCQVGRPRRGGLQGMASAACAAVAPAVPGCAACLRAQLKLGWFGQLQAMGEERRHGGR